MMIITGGGRSRENRTGGECKVLRKVGGVKMSGKMRGKTKWQESEG